MGRFLLLSFLPLVLVNFTYSRGWWSVCAAHWQECKSYYLKWQQQRLQFDRKELDCIQRAKNPSEMNLCIRQVRKERRKAFISWRREFGRKYTQWLKETKNPAEKNKGNTPQGKGTEQDTKGENK